MDKNVLLTIEYDGSEFSGWQKQPDKVTVQGYLEEILSGLLGGRVTLNGASRTDAGVHAYGQRASFRADINIPVERLAPVINNTLKRREKNSFALPPVRIVSAEEKPADFHARFDAKGKKYIYRIRNAEEPDIYMRNYVYHVASPLDTESMTQAAAYIKGTHDFKSFEASGGSPRETTVRTISDIKVVRTGESIEIRVFGDGFLYNMVRIMTGTLVDVGMGKMPAESVREIIDAKDRRKAGHTAPPYGLYLAEVYY